MALQIRRTLASAVYAALALTVTALGACDRESPTRPTVVEGSIQWIRWNYPDSTGRVGALLPLQFRVVGPEGQPLPGVAVRFALTEGDATLQSEQATTDSLGIADLVLRLGPTLSDIRGEASIVHGTGRAEFAAASSRLGIEVGSRFGGSRYGGDSLRLLPGCQAVLFNNVFEQRKRDTTWLNVSEVEYEVEDSSVVHLQRFTQTNRAWDLRARIVGAVRPGETRVILRYQDATDTAFVQVIPREEAVAGAISMGDSIYAPVGTKDRLGTTVREMGGCNLTDAAVTYSTDNSNVATVSAAGEVSIQAAGDAQITATSGALSDTLRIFARHVRVEPADTTIVVGGKVNYRLLLGDPAGVWTEIPRSVSSSCDCVDRDGATGILTGVAPGVAQVRVRSDVSVYRKIEGYATLRIAEP